MEFHDKLNEYIALLHCSAKELAQLSGLSTATISRYRSGERIPEASEHLTALVEALAQIAQNNGQTDLSGEAIYHAFAELISVDITDTAILQKNFNTLLTALSINVSELAKALNYDPSYISRIRNGQRQPADPQKFASKTARFIVRRYSGAAERVAAAHLINCDPDALNQPEHYFLSLLQWLTRAPSPVKNSFSAFLEKLDSFDLNEYIRAIHFDELKVPSAPFQLPTSKSYFGLKEMMDSELAFLKATVLSKSKEPVIMYSDMPMEEMAKDPEFPKKWMFGMAMMLKKGLHLHQIHNIDRSFEDMMLGLESWIPMYMTGQVSPYYLKGTQNSVFSHFLKVSGSAALTGEAISGFHSDGKYYLTKNKEEVQYYQKRAQQLLKKAYPLMEIYRQDSAQAYHAFLQHDAKTAGTRRSILSSLPVYTASDALIEQILTHNHIDQTSEILQFAAIQRALLTEILGHSCAVDEVPLLTQDEFEQFPMVLSLSGMFHETDIVYTWRDYQEHLQQTREFAYQNANYTVKENTSSEFRNIQISIHEGKWVIVSKNKAPAIHFLIRHPKMRNAFENMVLPITEV